MPMRRIRNTRTARTKLIKVFKRGFLQGIRNPAGNKKSVYIAVGMAKGWGAFDVKSHRKVSQSRPRESAEAFALRLAKAGHKTVIFRD